ncbi:HAMP domain-containing sensor histidine kinase [Herbaspirillum sp. WKF16]|jgi:signal transduction histidine kinase|uniref:ATP-binding protein n=1 Tax=Herbaspirillum sp. WKF16 TaxID=3028312 RepID=UPI0023A9F739|nr:HAMP domain-containing sensor histidine kinase [Herbaspirillum sp. WKF16]WDZ95856.1 HAMP domain-containing sensor histidine kinase [Herbaspirillum sp. WKF16]
MSDAVAAAPRRLLRVPRTLGSRLFLILLAGLALAHVLSFGVLFLERYMAARAVMLDTLENDVATSVAILDRLPAAERPEWIGPLQRGTYGYVIGEGMAGVPELSPRAEAIAGKIRDALGARYPFRMETVPGPREHLQAHLQLSDGSALAVDIKPAMKPLTQWLPYVLAAQLLVLVLCSWFAVRLALRPLADLADAADRLDMSKNAPPLREDGPVEVAHAATAFNAMRERISDYLQERVQILAAVSHDLQTPLTRMKLRAEMAEESVERDKLMSDLAEIGRLVQEGIAYARSAHGSTEAPVRIDLASFLESMVFDYQDTGRDVSMPVGVSALALVTRTQALRRILTNLIDNALKFGGAAEVEARLLEGGKVAIFVRDRGPGIPAGQLEAVFQPFFRLESSRNRGTGGTGLGLAIAQQLALALNGSLVLRNRGDGLGGLEAELVVSSLG